MLLAAEPFLQLVLVRLENETPVSARPWNARVRHRMLQIHYGNPRIHYELWLQGKTGRAEIGLHFEDERGLNQRWCALFAGRVFELQHALGPAIDLEEWTASWTRLHLTLPLEPLTEGYAGRIAGRMGRLIGLTCEAIQQHGVVGAAV